MDRNIENPPCIGKGEFKSRISSVIACAVLLAVLQAADSLHALMKRVQPAKSCEQVTLTILTTSNANIYIYICI